MPSDQLRAEISVIYKRDLAKTLSAQLAQFFRVPSDDPVACAAQTALATMTKSLQLVVFARNRDGTVVHYMWEDVASLKVFVEYLHQTTTKSRDEDKRNFEKIIGDDFKQLKRFSKAYKYKIASIHVSISMNEAQQGLAEEKSFTQRFAAIWQSTSTISKAAGVIATAAAAYVVSTDGVTMAKATLVGIFALVLSTLFEAVSADPFKIKWS